MKKILTASISALAMFAAVQPAYAQTAGAIADSDDNDDEIRPGIGEIVVTAQRREESLQTVPVAVTALGAAELAEARVVNINNLTGYAPNLEITNQGLASIPRVQLRGIVSGVSDNAVDPKVGIYLDGVYIGRTVGAIFDLADLERVEVLRGPQGTLFGRNSTGGAISLVSADPTGQFGVRGSLSYGNYDALRGRGVLNLPQFGPVRMKIAYLHDEIEGDVDNLIGGTTTDFSQLTLSNPSESAAKLSEEFGVFTYADKLGMKNVDAFMIAAQIDAAPGVTIDYKYDFSDTKSTGRPTQTLGAAGGAVGPLAGGIIAFQPAFGGQPNLSSEPLDAVANSTTVEHTRSQGHNLTVTWDANNNLTVRNIFGYRKQRQDPNSYDLGSTGGYRFSVGQFAALLQGNVAGVFNPAVAPAENDRFYTLLTARSTSSEQVSDELQFLVTTDAFDLTAGLFYFHESAPQLAYLGVFQPVTGGVVRVTPFDNIFGSGVTDQSATNDSMAGYAQMTYHVNDRLDLTLGGRYTLDDRDTTLNSVPGAAGAGALVGRSYALSYSRFNYTAIVGYDFTPDIYGYAKIATGYVAGGLLSAIPYDPESLTSYEAGVKSTLFNNRVRANLVGFYSDYKDLQLQQFRDGVQTFENAGKAKIYGFEGEFQFAPFDNVDLHANVGYTKVDFKEYISGGVDVADIVVPLSTPKWNARIGGRWDIAEFDNFATFYVSGDARYRSKIFRNNLFPGNPAIDDKTIDPALWLVDGRIGVADIPVGFGEIGLSLWGQNILDERYSPFGPTAINSVIIYERGRTYGVELAFDF